MIEAIIHNNHSAFQMQSFSQFLLFINMEQMINFILTSIGLR